MDRPKFCWDPTPGVQYTGTGPCLFTPMQHVDRRIVTGIGQVGGCPLHAVQRFFARFPLGNSNAAPFAWCTRNGGAGGGGTFEFATWVEKGYGSVSV
ncbi:hypothetical protein FA13DRAFT_1738304 [Coprinellus micaceus]|uniref:Uncharacterized protein n=1 Tax=Coprinellus micaceus TaxID=71717 RepID=A0A4Y7SU31_COPMI|nr:hypothetical protein FA13DRAFT_1738304 [Coprinellus micaceus]